MSGDAGDDKLFGEGGWDALFGKDGDDELWGMDGNDLLDGGEGRDVLAGGAGDDAMEGGLGDDTYERGQLAAIRWSSVPAKATTPCVHRSAYTLGAELENLTLTGTARDRRHRQRAATTCWSATTPPTRCAAWPATTRSMAAAAPTR